MALLQRFDSLNSTDSSSLDCSSPLFASPSFSTAASSPNLNSKPLLDNFQDFSLAQTCPPECFYHAGVNPSTVSLDSVSSSVLSFYRLQAPPSSPWASVDHGLHLTRKIDLPYSIANLQEPAFWAAQQWQDVSEAADERDRLMSLMAPLERYPDAIPEEDSQWSFSTQPALIESPAAFPEDEAVKFLYQHREVASLAPSKPTPKSSRLARVKNVVRTIKLASFSLRRRSSTSSSKRQSVA